MPPRPPHAVGPDPHAEPDSACSWPAVLFGVALPGITEQGAGISAAVQTSLRPTSRLAGVLTLCASFGGAALAWAAYRLTFGISPDATLIASAASAAVTMAAAGVLARQLERRAWRVATGTYRREFSRAVKAAGRPGIATNASSGEPGHRRDAVVAGSWLMLDAPTVALVAGAVALTGGMGASADESERTTLGIVGAALVALCILRAMQFAFRATLARQRVCRRVALGQCIHCGYEYAREGLIGETRPCSECGYLWPKPPPRMFAADTPAVRQARENCPGCGYSLAGLPEGAVCPECGRRPTDR